MFPPFLTALLPRHRLPDLRAAAVLWVVFWLLYAVSPTGIMNDSIYGMLQSQTILESGRLDMAESFRQPLGPDHQRYFSPDLGYPYQVRPHGEAWHLWYPLGPSVLSLPVVAALRLVGYSAIGAHGEWLLAGELAMQRAAGAILGGAIVAISFLLARAFAPRRESILLAVAVGLSTQVFSTLSRTVWSDTWGVILLSVALVLLALAETRNHPLRPVLLATLLSWCYFCKPTYSISILVITGFVLWRHRREFWIYAATGASWAVGFALLNWSIEGHVLPDYYRLGQLMDLRGLKRRAAGLVISPGRGLLVFIPVLWWVGIAGLLRARGLVASQRPLAVLAWIAMVVYLGVMATWPNWWGGHSYGPRLQAGMLPWLVLWSAMVVGASVGKWRRAEVATIFVLVVLGAAIHGRGAWDDRVEDYNWRPEYIDKDPARLWHWHRPQFLEGFAPVRASSYPPWQPGIPVDFRYGHNAEPYLGEGWSVQETHWRWTDQSEAYFGFRLDEDPTRIMEIKFEAVPYLGQGALPHQRLTLAMNGNPTGELLLTQGHPVEYRFRIAPESLARRNLLHLTMPDATAPRDVEPGSQDPRPLGIGMLWIEYRWLEE